MIPIFDTPKEACVTESISENADTVTLVLAMPEFFAFRPGQFNMLGLPGMGEIPISISGSADHGCLIFHTIRVVGARSRVLSTLKAGEKIFFRGAFGSFWPLSNSIIDELVLIAGGLGLAPLRPVVLWGLKRPDVIKKMLIIYGVRSAERLIFTNDLKSWSGLVDLRVAVEDTTTGWGGYKGTAKDALPTNFTNPRDTVAFLCGPEIMMKSLAGDLRNRGVESKNIFLSLERNMQCAHGVCGRCQLGRYFVCKDGPVFSWNQISSLLQVSEL